VTRRIGWERVASSRRLWWGALAALFVFRLGFGLCGQLFAEDETQIYLLGLRFHATHQWPAFGPDVVWTKSEIPGALQALLVGVPLDIAPIPESPYVLLNLLSMASLCVFAWYLSARLRQVPRWLIFGWVLTIPWTLELSTHIINPSYVLPASLVFFLGFLEAWPPLTIRRVSSPLAHALMGAALGWLMQIHMSWPLLLPFVAAAFVARGREGPRAFALAAGAFALGALGTGSLLVPTFVKYGLAAGGGGVTQNLHLHWRNPFTTLGTTTARFLAFASLEVNRFIATGSVRQMVWLQQRWWLIPAAVFVWTVGIVHPIWMAVTAFRRRAAVAHWPAVRWMAIATVVLVSLSFFCVMEPAQARMFYLVAPVALLYAAYCWTFLDSPRWRKAAAVILAVNLFFQASLALTRLSGPSLYMDRPLLVDAIRLKQPGLFGYRRAFARGVPPEALASSVAGANAAADLEVAHAEVSRPVRDITVWSLEVRNRSARVAYRDLLCETRYYDAAGRVIERRAESVWVVIQPGASVRTELVDGATWQPAMVRADARILAAEPLQPVPLHGPADPRR
jgi:hypothetical protein